MWIQEVLTKQKHRFSYDLDLFTLVHKKKGPGDKGDQIFDLLVY